MGLKRENRTANRQLLLFLSASLLIAGCGFAAPWLFDAHWAVPFALWMDLAWVAVLIISIFRLRRCSLWIVVGLPLVLFWLPSILTLGCAWGPYACV